MPDPMQHVVVQSEGGVFTIAFNRPDKKNALSAAMYTSLADALTQAQGERAVRVLVLQGTEEVFTSGNDLGDFLSNPPKGIDSPVFRFLEALSHAEKPVVAAVAGPAVGIGTTMLLHCDLVVAASNARFSMPFSRLGLCPEGASSLLLPRLAGYQRAAEKLLLGDPFDASGALQMGLVNRIVEPHEVLREASTLARRLAELPPSSLRATKRLMKADVLPSISQRLREEAAQFAAMLESPEAGEAFRAFFERRPADFSKF